jgi:hypothetical protein
MLEARAGTFPSAQHWFSQPDSGYSVDNVAPFAPAPFQGVYAAGGANLHWRPNTEADLAGYRLYRGPTASFPLDVAHRVRRARGHSVSGPRRSARVLPAHRGWTSTATSRPRRR